MLLQHENPQQLPESRKSLQPQTDGTEQKHFSGVFMKAAAN